MKLYVRYNPSLICRKVLDQQLRSLNIPHEMSGLTELKILDDISDKTLFSLQHSLKEYGIELLENQKSVLVEKTKDAIIAMIASEEPFMNIKVSRYLTDKLNHSYNYLSGVFSELTYTTIEKFIIVQKIERVKQLLLLDKLTLTEISYKLNYSSVAHLSAQFKKTTGLTPSAFQRIIRKRQVSETED